MTILSEMRSFLDGQIKARADVDKARNIELICYYYGFGDSVLPTLEETALRYDISRQRVDQIRKRDFQGVITPDHIPSLFRFQALLSSQPYWNASSLDAAVSEAGVAGDSFSLPGLLRLLDELKLKHSYAAFSADLRVATRPALHETSSYFLLQQQDVPHFRSLLQQARAFPGLKGIARIEDLESIHDDFAAHRSLMLNIIRRHPETWVRQREDGLWYLFEDRDNSLINSGTKALTAFEECDLTRLAQSSHSALRRRTNKYVRPAVDLIEDYLSTSRHFVVDAGTVRRPPKFELGSLNSIEEDAIEYLREKPDVSFAFARDFLQSKGHSRENISFALTMSSLVFVDKTSGRGHYTYHTVEPIGPGQPESPSTEKRYSEFRDRLHDLRDTDSNSEQSARREQNILGQWLFEGKETETCALCGREFTVVALVTAHKKRRADCNEGERRDPHIVMPLCQFGCDYLYERQHIYVEEGIIRRGVPLQSGGVEDAHAHELVGRRLEERWLEGHFHRPANEGGQ